MTVQSATDNAAHQKLEKVHVRHIGELEKASFEVQPTITLQVLWDRSYKELGIQKKDRDVFQAPHKGNPIDLTPYIGLTLAEAHRKDLCKDHFEIAAGTGGA